MMGNSFLKEGLWAVLLSSCSLSFALIKSRSGSFRLVFNAGVAPLKQPFCWDFATSDGWDF